MTSEPPQITNIEHEGENVNEVALRSYLSKIEKTYQTCGLTNNLVLPRLDTVGEPFFCSWTRQRLVCSDKRDC